MKKIINFLEKYKILIVVIVFIASILLFFDTKIEKTPTHKYVVEESFDMRKVPSGTVIWVHGVPNYEEEGFVWMDEDNRYEYFDVGIWNQYDGFVYKIRIPFYARGMFPLGIIINPKKNNNKHNPKENKNYKLL